MDGEIACRVLPAAHVRKPASCSIAVNPAGVYLYEFSVWMRSPAANVRAPPGMLTRCSRLASRCISILPRRSS
mgnify:CR=1 FL=1